jgi:hypothetical protein
MRELGRSQREEDGRIEKARTWTLRHEVNEVESRMHANGERPPRGDIHTAAVEEVAETADIKPPEADAEWEARMAELAKSETARLEAERRRELATIAGQIAAESLRHVSRRGARSTPTPRRRRP